MNVAAIFRQTSKLQDDLTMYIPKINLATDRDEIVSFMKQFSFATIVTAKDNIPIATHLPFLVSLNGENIVLTSHFAKANEQWKGIENHDALVIFSEPLRIFHQSIMTKS